ncbi:hypothetical protein T01_4484 [Trichinella spiralis]|uniref:Uncharacterized protein n=1 Tax=Trichinella spiralis TaxID=6334 RepID=A0A0V0YQC4_TRISP|nr:hypothetical protein T01_4484 [Trichinella spiralis]
MQTSKKKIYWEHMILKREYSDGIMISKTMLR